MRLRNYPGVVSWPPLPGGAYSGYEEFPLDESAVVISQVFPVVNEFVTFTCEFKGRRHTYDLQVQDEETASELARLLCRRHIGNTLQSLGECRLDY